MISRDRLEPNGSSRPAENTAQSYERLRAWYLAHLRKSQLVSDITSGVTPATLMKRDREALEQLIAESPSPKLAVASSAPAPKVDRPFINLLALMVSANAVALACLLFGTRYALNDDVIIKLGLGLLLLLTSILAVALAKAFYRTHLTLEAVTQREQVIADFALESFWSFDTAYNFVAVSPATERLLGVSTFRLLNKSLFSVVPKEEEDRLRQFFAAAKNSKDLKNFGRAAKIETQVLRDDGTLVDIEVSAEYSLSDAAFYCVAANISERKDVERLKEQLMAMLSHDLKTPLSSLKFSLALLGTSASGELTAEGRNILKVGENNVVRLINLINQLLDLHKLDARQLQLTLKDVRVSEIIQPALEAIESYADQKQIEVLIEAEEVTIRADQDRMLQVVINLLSNAIKYSPAETKIILSVKTLPGNWLAEIRVSDSGPGIAKEHRQAVFDRFYRIAAKDGQGEEGTGLGLAICKAIVEAHGGKIDVESEPGKGASFYCHVPMIADKAR
jgi:PAS domain S-box-containing protein